MRKIYAITVLSTINYISAQAGNKSSWAIVIHILGYV